jgi:hypothetical protein
VTRTAMGGLFAGFISGAIVVLVGLGSQPGAAQSPAPGSVIPRTASGKPDLNGLWQALTSANYDIQAHTARPAMAMRPGPVVPLPAKEVLALGAVGAVPSGAGIVDGDELPYLPAALEQRKKNQENWLTLDPEIKCYLPGIPRATYMPFPFQIVQSDSAFFMAYEYAGATRNIFLKDPGPPQVDAWMGQAVGRWDGDTFVIESNGFNDQTWFDRAGNWHTEQLHLVERFTRTGPDHLLYEATIEDPQVYTRPWKISMPLYRRVEKNAQLMEFKCVEFVEELMYGQYRKNPLPR